VGGGIGITEVRLLEEFPEALEAPGFHEQLGDFLRRCDGGRLGMVGMQLEPGAVEWWQGGWWTWFGWEVESSWRGMTEDHLDGRLFRGLVVRQGDRSGVELFPGSAVHEDLGDWAGTGGGEVELFATKPYWEALLESADGWGDMGPQGQSIGVIKIFEEPPERGGGRAEGVVGEVDGLVGLIDVATELDQWVVEAEALGEGQPLAERAADIVEPAEAGVTEDHPGFAGGPMAAVDPGAEGPEAGGCFVHVVVGGEVGEDEVVWSQAGDRGDFGVDAFRLRVIDHSEGDGILVRRGFEVTVTGSPENAVAGAVGIEGIKEVAFVGDELGQGGTGGGATFAVQVRLPVASGEGLQLDEAVERGDVSYRDSGVVGFVVCAVWLSPTGDAGGQQIAGGAHAKEVVVGVTTSLDELGAAFEFREVTFDRVGVTLDEEEFGLHEQSGGGELDAPVVQLGLAVALFVDDPAGACGVAETTVRGDPIKWGRGADALAVPHLIEPQVLGVLEEGGEGFLEEGKGGVGGAVAVLDPPGVPGGAFHEPIPGGHVEHGKILELGVGCQRPSGDIQETEVFGIPTAMEEESLVLGFCG